MFVSSTVQSVEGFAHHVEFCLAVSFEDAGVPLAEHQRDEMVCYASGTESRSERVTQLVEREIRDPRSI